MSLMPVNSEAIAAVGYDPLGGTLFVQFHTSDTVYPHYGVPPWVFLELMSASSMGAYYNRRIRGRYR